ncbi:MAG: 4-(cytidine 5'-diphospho)-2-C-methyl-D-erythritol kinase, partial [Ktedonobacterales bacterium]
SDVPFFVRGGRALIGGRGEIVRPLPDAEPLWIVLLMPPVAVSTAAAFGALTPRDYVAGDDSAAMVAAIRTREPLPLARCSNALERSVVAAYPEVGAALDVLRAAGAPVACMSGSGAAVFAPFRELAGAARVYAAVRERGQPAWLTHTVTAAECRLSRTLQG